MRKNEFDVLASTLYPRIADKRYGNNRTAYTVLLGDYNLNLKESGAGSPYLCESIIIEDQKILKIQGGIITESYNTNYRNGSKQIVTVQKELTTLRNPKDGFGQQGFSNNYDHFTYDAKQFEGVNVRCHCIDSVKKCCDGDFELHRKNISDHIPVVMEFDLLKG